VAERSAALLGRGDRGDRLLTGILDAADPDLALTSLERLAAVASPSALAALAPDDLDALVVVCGASPFLVRFLVSRGDAWPALVGGWRASAPTEATLRAMLDASGSLASATLAARLREVAMREFYRIGTRDLVGVAPLEETLESLTRLAEVTVDAAVRGVRARLVAEAGDAAGPDGRPVAFAVLGLGKLGGRELNYSSDIDLCYVYETDDVAGNSPPAREFFARLAAGVTRMVGETTADGRVFRVDLRLRPEGAAGPIVNSLDNILGYYEGWGDTWERGALAKARPVAGDPALGRRFVSTIAAFVYRRHLDFRTIEDLRQMKERIDAELAMQHPGARDVKVGRGGIREVEFAVQVLQLIHGGHHPSVRETGTMAALSRLEEASLVRPEDAVALRSAYRFLRDVEHAIQIEEGRQTHTLPDDEARRIALARRLGYGRRSGRQRPATNVLDAFERDWTCATDRVHEIFLRYVELRPVAEDRARAPRDSAGVALLGRLADDDLEGAGTLLAGLGLAEPTRVVEALASLYSGRLRSGPASPQRRRALEELMPALLPAVLTCPDPDRAVDGLVQFLIRTGAHTSYLALLGGSTRTMEILVNLFASSAYLARHLVGHPELLDSLVRGDQVPVVRDVDALARELAEELSAATGEPDRAEYQEAVLAGLRRFRTVELVRVGLADLSGELDDAAIHRQLSRSAEVTVAAAVERARDIVSSQGGPPWPRLELAVIAMGKFGAEEMTYGSDLDLIFVYDSGRDDYDGEAHVAATRWVHKVIALLTSRTADGIAYEVDTRLRPSGNSGPIVTSLARFVAYHEGEAALWERQALIRARVVAGPAALRSRLERVIEATVWSDGLRASGVAEIDALRRRMEVELAGEGPGRLNIKTGRGGLADVEFLVQMLQLRHAVAVPDLRRRATPEAIAALAAAGHLTPTDAQVLADGYRFLRRLEARLRLEWARPVQELRVDARRLGPLARRLGLTDGRELLERCRTVRASIREVYERFFGSRPR
jgi:glutamate-ammonia-ligase adenylyltransferase